MGDLKVNEGFRDVVMIRKNSDGTAATGLSPTCTAMKLSDGSITALTVAELSLGAYQVTDWTPDTDTEYLTIWAVTGNYTIYVAYKLFKVGGGRTEDTHNSIAQHRGVCDSGMGASTTTIVCEDLYNFGDDYFNTDWVMIVFKNANSVGNAPEGQIRDITNYVSATGTFTVTAFGANVEENDIILVARREQYIIDGVALQTTPATDSLAYKLSQYLASGDGDWAGGTALPSNVSLYDVVKALSYLAGTGTPTQNSFLDYIMNKDGGQTFARATDSLEAIRELADTLATAAALAIIDAFHDVATADAVTNAVMSDVIGNKTDAATQDADATTKTIISMVKGILDVLIDTDGISVWAAEAAPGNNVSLHEVIRAIYNDTHELQTDDIPTLLGVIDGYHDVPAQDSADNAQMRDVIGNKTDAAVQDADDATTSIMAYVKGIIDVLIDTDGIAVWAAAAAPGNNVSLHEVIRSIYDDTHELQGDWTNGGRLDLILDAIAADVVDTKEGKTQVLEVSITNAANAGVTTVATVTDQPCIIESVIIHADTVQTADMTSCAVEGGVGQVVTFIGVGDALQANLDAADKQVSWTGNVRLAASKTITIDLQGTGATAVDLTITIKYRACIDGGYLV